MSALLHAAAWGAAVFLTAGFCRAEPPPSGSAEVPRALLGAQAPPPLRFVLTGEAGMIFLLPELGAGILLGTGGGSSVSLRYRNIAGLGHCGRLRAAWGTRITNRLAYGVALETSITSLGLADGGLIGIQFSNIALGNDWEVGSHFVLTWLRPGSAHITFSLGPGFTLGGVRYTSFDEKEFRIEPGLRSASAAVQGEWELNKKLHMFLRLDGLILLKTRIAPFGFVPTGSAGLGWSV